MTGRARSDRLQNLKAAVTGTLWPLPALAVVVAIGLGIGVPFLDEALQAGLKEPLALVFTGGPSAARTMLSVIASSLISVTTLLFSLTIVTLQLASSQYSPRLLQTFVRDRVVQSCLAVLLGTFVYALTVLRSVRSADESDSGAFVPRLSVTMAFVFALASVGALVTFLSHQTRQLRVETMLRDVHVEAAATVRRLADAADEDGQPDAELPPVPDDARPILARHSGFLVSTGEPGLLAAAAEAGAVLRVVPRPGEPVIEGTPVAWAWSDGTGREPDPQQLEAALHEHVSVGYERADHGDPSYGLRKLIDIAARALSPGINDPTTAVHALSHVSDLLGEAGRRTHWNRRLADDEGRQRLLIPSWDFATLLELSFTQPRHYGRNDVDVVGRMFAVLAELGWRVSGAEQCAAVRRQCELLTEQFLEAPPRGWSTEDVRRAADRVDRALARRPPTT